MFEATAVFAVGEFAEAVGYKRRSEDRKSVVPALEFVSTCSLNDKQEFMRKMHELPTQDIPYLSPRQFHTVNALPAVAIQYLLY